MFGQKVSTRRNFLEETVILAENPIKFYEYLLRTTSTRPLGQAGFRILQGSAAKTKKPTRLLREKAFAFPGVTAGATRFRAGRGRAVSHIFISTALHLLR
jgi:hypothetical protein